MELSEIAARLQRLEDIETARGIFHLYAETLDVPDAKTVAELFTETGVLRTPMGDFTGRDAIRDFYASAFEADHSLKRHFIVNPKVVEVSPGSVRIQSYFLYTGRGDDSSIIGWGTYDDTIDVSGDEPRFSSKKIEVHVGTDLATGWAKETQ